MLDLRRNDFTAPRRRGNRAENREIIRLGAATGEHNLTRIGADDRSDLRARELEYPARALTRAMHRRGIPRPLGDEAKNRFRRLRSKRSARVMIKINRHGQFGTPSMKRLAYLTATNRKSALRHGNVGLENSRE